MKTSNSLTNIILYGRLAWQIFLSRIFSKKGIEGILNYRYISQKLATGGQPKAGEFEFIRESGYQTVINLAPLNSSNALANEQEIVTNLGIEYINIPVIWDHPTIEDLSHFCRIMETSKEPIFVHCAMNMRVSAFVYLYRRLILGISESEAYSALTSIWQPNSTWQKFIESAIATQTNS
jgi:protein tyrosine phosphatase (PTP) superfamily phosphohydrolase (DUF442 family)